MIITSVKRALSDASLELLRIQQLGRGIGLQVEVINLPFAEHERMVACPFVSRLFAAIKWAT